MTASALRASPLTLRRHLGIAITVCAFAWLAALPAHNGAAQDHSASPSPDGLWKAYPLDPTAEPGTQPEQASSPTTSASTDRRTVSTASARGDGGSPLLLLVLVAFVTAAGMLTFVGVRRRRESEPATAAAASPSGAVAGPRPALALWHGQTARFNRAVANTPAKATLVASRGQESDGPRAAADLPRPTGPTGPAAGNKPPPAAEPAPAPAPPGSPPDPRLGWAAEIEWREVGDESRFCVIARGAGTVQIAQSAPLDWPPEGPAAVQAVTDAADKLATTLVAAGWKPLPPGSSWYAKRFAWEPSGSSGPKAVTPPPATSEESDAPERVRSGRARAKQFAVLALLAVVAVIAALRLGDSDGDGGSRAKPDAGIDLSVPLLVVVGLALLVLAVMQFRSTLRGTSPQETKEKQSPR